MLVFCFCFGCVVLIVVRCGFGCKCLVVVLLVFAVVGRCLIWFVYWCGCGLFW